MIKKITLGCLGALLSINTAFASDTATLVEDKIHKAKVIETKNAGGYTYIKLEEKGEQYWAAVPGVKVKVGEKITLKESTWMQNFKSKSLNQTFDKILFADILNKKGISGSANVHGIHGQMTKKKQEVKKPDPKFNENMFIAKNAPIKTTINTLYNETAKYKNKNVEVEATVLQVSNKVMGNTWVKLFDGKDAIIFRSANEDEKLKKDDKVRVIGTLNTDVDYGYGFKYELIGVNAKFTKIN